MSPHVYQEYQKIIQKSRPHHHHHHHHHRRRRHHHHRHDHHQQQQQHRNHHDSCPRKHRSHTDVSTTSVNTCHDSCPDHEVREILIKRPCCSTSKTELVQYFVEDLYGTARRTSCCTSSDYCYHTDSTSLYGSRSSLSRNNSIKSGSIIIRRKKSHHRQPSYGSLSLGRLNHQSHPNSLGSLTSIFDKTRETGSGRIIVSPSKVTIEHQSKDGTSKELPEYACSPSPIRWSFLADSESKTPSDFDGAAAPESRIEGHRKSCDRQCRSKYHDGNTLDRSGGVDCEESTTVVFHQEGEAFNNCCNNYLQCNAFLDQDLQITSEDICVYLSKGNKGGEILNNSVNYPFQPTGTLEFQYKNNFGDSHNNSPEFRRLNNKETNLSQNNAIESFQASNSPLSPTNINLSSSSNNINIIFNSYLEHNNTNEVKFINTSREQDVSTERHHSAYLPYTYPNCDNTNMSSNSLFDKPLGIDEIPSSAGPSSNIAESLETSSSHNLLYYRYSSYSDGQQSFELSTSPTTPRRHHSNHRWHHHVADNLKITNALRRVRKRARKCAQYLRKK